MSSLHLLLRIDKLANDHMAAVKRVAITRPRKASMSFGSSSINIFRAITSFWWTRPSFLTSYLIWSKAYEIIICICQWHKHNYVRYKLTLNVGTPSLLPSSFASFGKAASFRTSYFIEEMFSKFFAISLLNFFPRIGLLRTWPSSCLHTSEENVAKPSKGFSFLMWKLNSTGHPWKWYYNVSLNSSQCLSKKT